MKKHVLDLEVVSNIRLNDEYVVVAVTHTEKLPDMLPGQFVQVLVEDSPTTFLRRPISIHDYDPETNIMSLLIQEVGDGTRKMAKLGPGDTMNMLIPLGNWFTMPKEGDNVLLIGGGCGIAPLLFLGREMNKIGVRPHFLIGARTQERIFLIDRYKALGDVHITTEDGSVGKKGYVVHHDILWDENLKFDRIYTCGPDPMMKVVAKYAQKNNIYCEASLENMMACGFGVCLCCVIDTDKGHKNTCTEGPIFNVKNIKEWQI